MRLSTTDAWMKNWPHGVIVVPIAAIAVNSQSVSLCTCGTTAPRAAASQSGWDSRAEMM